MEEISYSKDIVDAITNYLTKLQNEEEIFFSFDELNEQIGRFRGFIPLPGLIKRVNYEILVGDDSYIVMAISPIGADWEDEEMMNRFRDFFTRINWDLDFGNFLFSETDGQIRYKYSVNCKDTIPSEDIICDSILIPGTMLDHYSPEILRIISYNLTVGEVIRRILLRDGLVEVENEDFEEDILDNDELFSEDD